MLWNEGDALRHVPLISYRETKCYLICVPSKETVGFDKIGIHDESNEMLLKVATFIFLDERNVRSNQPISVYDNVHMKTVMGKFLVSIEGGENVAANADTTSLSTAWNLMKADTPYIPEWVYHRSTFSKFLKVNAGEETYSRNDKSKQLGLNPPSVQEMKLVEDLLDVMLGFDGEYIKRDSNWNFVLEPNK